MQYGHKKLLRGRFSFEALSDSFLMETENCFSHVTMVLIKTQAGRTGSINQSLQRIHQ